MTMCNPVCLGFRNEMSMYGNGAFECEVDMDDAMDIDYGYDNWNNDSFAESTANMIMSAVSGCNHIDDLDELLGFEHQKLVSMNWKISYPLDPLRCPLHYK